jgi:hypothetical protein
MDTQFRLVPPLESPSPTVTAAERLASEIAEAIDAIAARIPQLEAPHPSTATGVRGARTVSREFIVSMIAAVEAMPELQSVHTFDPEEARATLQFIDAFRPIADRLAALLASVNYTVASRRAKVASAAMTTYAVARGLARDPESAPRPPTSTSSAATSDERTARRTASLTRPRQRRSERRHRRRQLLGVRARDVFELARQYVIDRRPMPRRKRHEHVALISRHSHSQQHQPDRLRQHPRRVIAERRFDDPLLPHPHRSCDQLLFRDTHPHSRRNRYNRATVDVAFQLIHRDAEELGGSDEREVRTAVKEDAADAMEGGFGHGWPPHDY